jgi:hypothetical protein
MELFDRAKTVRLRSHHDKYLYADEDESHVTQDRNASSPNARWLVELVPHSPGVLRLRSRYGRYLSASNEPFLLGATPPSSGSLTAGASAPTAASTRGTATSSAPTPGSRRGATPSLTTSRTTSPAGCSGTSRSSRPSRPRDPTTTRPPIPPRRRTNRLRPLPPRSRRQR